jgi:integrase/recombinase XerD
MSVLTYEIVRELVREELTTLNYSERSVVTILEILKRFAGYLDHEKIRDYREVAEAGFFAFLDYVSRTAKRGIKKETLHGYGLTIKRIFSMLLEADKILKNPFHDIELVKVPRSIRDKILTEKEMSEVLESIPTDTPLLFRDRTIFEVFYGTGIRARELLNLELSDFLKEEKMLFIRNGKGKKDRIVPLGETAFKFLSQYVRKVRSRYVNRRNRAHAKYLFLNVYGRKLLKDALEVIFKKARKNSPVERHFSPHVIRHTFATHLIQSGADVREVQLLLGHASLKATEVYLNLTDAHLKEVYKKFHPLENELYFDPEAKESYVLEWIKKRQIFEFKVKKT